MKKILLSLSMIAAIAVVAIGATGAFFSDTETSTGNTFTAGAIDLGIDNTSYYNGVFNQGTSWALDFDIDPLLGDDPSTATTTETDFVLEPGRLFFNFTDVKPGDYGEDTISIHVNDNDAWACVDVTLTKDDDVDCTEPENDADAENGACAEPDTDETDGELADAVEFLWWHDDGDNVLETNENVINSGVVLGSLQVGQTATVPLAAATGTAVFGNIPLTGATTTYIGKAWCFGDITPAPVTQDNSGVTMTPAGNNDGNGTAGEPTDGGFTCNGASSIGNSTQTDSLMANISFRAEQSRNNPNFSCALPPTNGTN